MFYGDSGHGPTQHYTISRARQYGGWAATDNDNIKPGHASTYRRRCVQDIRIDEVEIKG